MSSAMLSIDDTAAAGSAAQQVFALPELLTEILLHLSPSSDPMHRVPGAQPRPSMELFVLQRVNTTFQDTISRSDTLQQRMGLMSWPEEMDETWEVDAVDWLAAIIGITNNGSELSGKVSHLRVRKTQRAKRECPPHLKSTTASWRKIKTHCFDGGSLAPGTIFARRSTALSEIRLERGMTMGRLHGGLQWLLPFIAAYDDAAYEHRWYAHIRRSRGRRGMDKNVVQRMEHSSKRLKDEIARDDIWA